MSDNSTRVITPIATLSYPHLHEPQKARKAGQKEKYSCALVFAPGTDLKALEQAALAAAEERWGSKATEMFRTGALRSPFRRDAEAKGYPAGSVFVNVRSEQKPRVVYAWAGGDGKPAAMADENVKTEMYAGAQVRASIGAFAYDTDGNKGVSFGLNNLQKMGEGARIDGRRAAEDEFDVDLNAKPADLESIL